VPRPCPVVVPPKLNAAQNPVLCYLPRLMRRTLALALAAGLLACATKHTSATGTLRLGKTPEENYQRGVDELKARNYAEAVRFFDFVKAKYPFSPVSVSADLRLADVRFAQKRWTEAAAAYEDFVKAHPSSSELEFAQFRAGVSHWKASPGDFFLLPPAEEKDLGEADKAVVLLRDFLAQHPTSKWAGEAKEALGKAELLVAKREMYAGDFYFRQGYWTGAALRYKGVADDYPATRLAEPALLKLSQSYVKLNENHQARQALQRLITQHPSSPYRGPAERLLEKLR